MERVQQVAGIEAGLRHLGHSVGCYTSPHIVHYRERIRINGADASDAAIIGGFERVKQAQGDTRLTYFEFATLGALATFSEAELDYAVLEIGLGGRLDAVNVIDADLAVITTIGMDHQEYLGDDRETIGREKAGIMRQDQVVVCSDRNPPNSISETAKALDVSLLRIGDDYDVVQDPDTAQWRYRFGDHDLEFPVRLNGAHLATNLAGAMTAVTSIYEGAGSDPSSLARVVASTLLPGRLQMVRDAPRVYLDVGHNPLAAEAINAFLEREGLTNAHGVIAMLSDKDAEGVALALSDQVSHWYCAGLDVPRGQDGEDLAARIRSVVPSHPVESHCDVPGAIDAAIQNASDNDTVVIFGSFHTVELAAKYFDI